MCFGVGFAISVIEWFVGCVQMILISDQFNLHSALLKSKVAASLHILFLDT